MQLTDSRSLLVFGFSKKQLLIVAILMIVAIKWAKSPLYRPLPIIG